ncbi:MAG: acetyltransferase [Bacteroidota bacterium]
MTKVGIIGGGDLGRQFRHYISQAPKAQVVGWYDDTVVAGTEVSGLPVMGGLSDLTGDSELKLAIAIGYKHIAFKIKLLSQLQHLGASLYTFAHPSSFIDKESLVEAGVFIYPGCVVEKNVVIEKGALLNNGVIVSHDSRVGAASFIAPGVTICGNATIGKGCFVGAGTIISDGVSIPDFTTLGAGTLVHQTIESSGTYVTKTVLRRIK